MNVINYILFAVLAIISVLALRGDLYYFFPTLWGYFENFHFYLGVMYNQFNGYRAPVNPDPTEQNLSHRMPITYFPVIMSIGIAVSVLFTMIMFMR